MVRVPASLTIIPMKLHPHRALRAAFVLLAAGAALTGATPAAAQNPQPPTLRNEAEVARQSAALYPAALRDSAVQGEVVLKFRVLEDSTVDSASVSVVEASNPAFAEPAMAVARVMRFAPARVGGSPAAVWIRYPVEFEIPRPAASVGPTIPEEGTYELAAIEEFPRLLNGAVVSRSFTQSYPPALRDSSVSGDVIVRFRVVEDGTVDPATTEAILSTDLAFEEPAIAGVRLMRFRPAKVGGRPVKAWIEIPIHFSVQTDEPAGAPRPEQND
jgi:TonB family protein